MPNRAIELSSKLSVCNNYSSLENMLFKSVAEELGAETSVLLQFHQRKRGYEFARNTPLGVSSQMHDNYISKFHHTDPVLVHGRQIRRPTPQSDATTNVFRLSDVSDNSSFTQTQYYNEFLKPVGIRHVLALAVRPQSESNDLLVVIGFHRPFGSNDFGETALRKAVEIAPIVGSTIARITFKENMNRYRELAEDMQVLAQEVGFILLDERFEIQRTNLHSAVIGGPEFASLFAQVQSVCATLLAANQNHASFAHRNEAATGAILDSNVSVEINVVTSATGEPRFVIQLGNSQTNVAITQCARQFSWTERECEIVMAVAQGLSNPQIASYLSISTRTVENHLRAVYSKADVTSRTQLLRHLLHHPPTREAIFSSHTTCH